MAEKFNIEIGLKIHNLRKAKKMSMKQLGELVNLHESTVSRYEKGKIESLDIDKLKEFAVALGVSASYLMGWEEETDNKGIGNKLKELRLAHHLSIMEMANELGLETETLMQYEKGEKQIPEHVIELYKAYFNVDAIVVENDQTALITKNEKLRERYKRWEQEFAYPGAFTDKQVEYIIRFAKLLRDDLNDADVEDLFDYAKYLTIKRKR